MVSKWLTIIYNVLVWTCTTLPATSCNHSTVQERRTASRCFWIICLTLSIVLRCLSLSLSLSIDQTWRGVRRGGSSQVPISHLSFHSSSSAVCLLPAFSFEFSALFSFLSKLWIYSYYSTHNGTMVRLPQHPERTMIMYIYLLNEVRDLIVCFRPISRTIRRSSIWSLNSWYGLFNDQHWISREQSGVSVVKAKTNFLLPKINVNGGKNDIIWFQLVAKAKFHIFLYEKIIKNYIDK